MELPTPPLHPSRGYEDRDWWPKLHADGVFFVSRLKDGASSLRDR
jgi:hypothetical protein